MLFTKGGNSVSKNQLDKLSPFLFDFEQCKGDKHESTLVTELPPFIDFAQCFLSAEENPFCMIY